MTRHRIGVVIGTVFAAVVVTGAALGLPSFLRRVAFFRIRQVEVVGNRYLDAASVVARLHLRPGASIFDRLGRVSAAAAAIPGVHSASVVRRLPATLLVTLHEIPPVALAAGGSRLVLIDERGRDLPFDPVHAPGSFPIATRDSLTAGLLSRLRLADPHWYDSVQTARLDGRDVLLETGSHTIRFDADADDDIMRAVIAVRGYLASHHVGWSEIDARYRSRVFVRKASS
ncbi:MAG: cell division protein FtsQ/DivIB [Gemmatimonadales bacterium]